MKRDVDLVRDLLLCLEEYDPPHGQDILEPPFDELPLQALVQAGRSPEEIGQHVAWLYEAGFLTGEYYSPRDGYTFRSLSWQGCEYLDDVRDPEVWRRTKEGASKVGGASLSFAWEMAKAYGKQVAKERLGLDL